MNREAMLAVADVIEYFDRFDIGSWVSPENDDDDDLTANEVWTQCGTTACVAGWTLAWADKPVDRWSSESNIRRARAELGLTDAQARQLFVPSGSVWWDVPNPPTARDAATQLRRIANGEVVL